MIYYYFFTVTTPDTATDLMAIIRRFRTEKKTGLSKLSQRLLGRSTETEEKIFQ